MKGIVNCVEQTAGKAAGGNITRCRRQTDCSGRTSDGVMSGFDEEIQEEFHERDECSDVLRYRKRTQCSGNRTGDPVCLQRKICFHGTLFKRKSEYGV